MATTGRMRKREKDIIKRTISHALISNLRNVMEAEISLCDKSTMFVTVRMICPVKRTKKKAT